MLFRTSLNDILLLDAFNSLYLRKALIFVFAVIKNLNSASGTITEQMSRPSKQEPLYFLGGL